MKKRILALVIGLVMLLGALCGCEDADFGLEPGDLYIGLEMEFKPSEPNRTSGVITETKTVGLSSRFYEGLKEAVMAEAETGTEGVEWFQYSMENSFENSGKTYIGDTETTNIGVSNAGVKVGDMEVKYTVDAVNVNLAWSDNSTADEVVERFNQNSDVNISSDIVWSIANMDLTLVFPNENIELEAAGIKATAVGNVVIINATGVEPEGHVNIKCNMPVENTSDEPSITAPTPAPTPAPSEKPLTGGGFSDVGPKDWFFEAVLALQGSGIINGTNPGEYHMYFGPNGTLTWEQMCQILAKASNLDSGFIDGYWAGKAIDSVILNGFINPLSDSLDPEVYGQVITREHAIAAVARAAEKVLPSVELDNSISESDIPDWSEIDAAEQADVLKAYQMGLTNGVDGTKRFDPKGEMTRAQACQLLYNMGWTTPAGKAGVFYLPNGEISQLDASGRPTQAK